MASTVIAGRTIRDTSLLARGWTALTVTARRYGPGVGRWLARTGTRIRQLVLYLGGFGSLVYAAFLLSAVLGFVALGVALLLLEALSGPGDGR